MMVGTTGSGEQEGEEEELMDVTDLKNERFRYVY